MTDSGDRLRPKHISPQLLTSHVKLSGMFNGGPILSLDQHPVREPVRDGLLLECRPRLADGPEVLPDASRKRLLASRNLDRSRKGDNVLVFHGPQPTRILVNVNKDDCETDNKRPCIVLQMGLAKRKPAVSKPAKAAEVGPDSLTFGQRLEKELGDRDIGQSELARICSRIYQRAHPRVSDKVKQQHIGNAIKTGQGSSEYLSLIAEALGVRATWLQYGIPPKEIDS